jgi:hypothetical protein
MKMKIKMKISRRSFTRRLLNMSAAAPILSHSAFDLVNNQTGNDERWLSAQGRNADTYGLGWINPPQESAEKIYANFRGHGLCQNPKKTEHVVMFSRRPGTHGLRFNTHTNDIDGRFHSIKDRYMQGHGCYSADGQWLYCTESSISSGEGKITVRDATTLEQINEFNSHGIGPHDIRLMPDGHTLIVANGGLLTHPNSGRKILNLETMCSSLSYIDSSNGELISEHFLAEPKASIRHIDVAADGTVAVALQVQREAMSNKELTPLAAIHKPGQPLKLLQAPEALMIKLNDYMGSVAIHDNYRIAGFTSPRGDLVMFWHLDDLSLQSYHVFHDVCGLTLSQNNKYFVLSNSAGKIRQINTRTLKVDKQKSLQFPEKNWDNHMISISLKRT